MKRTNNNRLGSFLDPEKPDRKKLGWAGFAALALGLLLVHFLLGLELFPILEPYQLFLRKLTLSLSIILIVLLIGKIIESIIHKRSESAGDRYNLLRITRLLVTILILIVIVSFLFQNLYGILAGFGLISLVLGFALQAPIASFIAWLYIIFRKPYKVGDRIQTGNFKGDVVEVNYLDTAILECSGHYLQNDRRSGRVIYFPNSLILRSEVINYSGPQVPFIWNETGIQVAYTSDLQFVENCLLEAAAFDFNQRYPQFTGEPEAWQPAVYFRINTYAWLEAVISYPVEPADTTGRRNRILRRALPMLNNDPDKVQFPKGSLR